MSDDFKLRPEGLQRVARLLAERGHAPVPVADVVADMAASPAAEAA